MKTLFVKMLLGYRGRMISILNGLVVAFITNKLAKFSVALSPEFHELIVGGVAFLVIWLTDGLALKFQADGAKQLQEVLPDHVKPDGVIGPVTVSAVEKVVSNQQTP